MDEFDGPGHRSPFSAGWRPVEGLRCLSCWQVSGGNITAPPARPSAAVKAETSLRQACCRIPRRADGASPGVRRHPRSARRDGGTFPGGSLCRHQRRPICGGEQARGRVEGRLGVDVEVILDSGRSVSGQEAVIAFFWLVSCGRERLGGVPSRAPPAGQDMAQRTASSGCFRQMRELSSWCTPMRHVSKMHSSPRRSAATRMSHAGPNVPPARAPSRLRSPQMKMPLHRARTKPGG